MDELISMISDDEALTAFVAKLDTASRREFDSIMFRTTLAFNRSTHNRLDRLESRVNVLFMALGALMVGNDIFGPTIGEIVKKAIGG